MWVDRSKTGRPAYRRPGAVADQVLLGGVHFAEGRSRRRARTSGRSRSRDRRAAARRGGRGPRRGTARSRRRARPGRAPRRNGRCGPGRRARAATRSIATRKSFAGPGPARRVDPGRAAERRHDEPGIVGQRRQARSPPPRLALSAPHWPRRSAGLLGLGHAERAAPTVSIANGASSAVDLVDLAGIVAGDDQAVAGECAAPSLSRARAPRAARGQVGDARRAPAPACRAKQRLVERRAFGGRLDLDDAARSRSARNWRRSSPANPRHSRGRARHPVDNAAGDRRDAVAERQRWQHPAERNR